MLQDLFFDYTVRTVALGAGLLGAVAGAIGSYAVLRRKSLLGDAVSHAALPGIALAWILTGSKSIPALLLGAAGAGLLGTALILFITRSSRVKEDSAQGLILSAFFGGGLVLLTLIQRSGDASQAGLETFLFGQAAALQVTDLWWMVGVGGVSVLLTLVFWKEFKLLSFDPGFLASLGRPVRVLDLLQTGIIVLAIVIGLQTVGVVLMSAMLVAPAAAARQWTQRMGVMLILAGLLGAVSGVSGALISSNVERLPTGPTMVLILTALVVISLFVAPARGLAWEWLRAARRRRNLQGETVMLQLLALCRGHGGDYHPHDMAVLAAMGPAPRRALNRLLEEGLVRTENGREWCLTPEGRSRAEALHQEREGEP